MSISRRSLKAQNVGWLWATVVVDAVALAAFAFPGVLSQFSAKDYAWVRASILAAAPVVVLLLTSLLPPDAKAVLVFWRLRDALPASRAFSLYAPRDPRIDIRQLQHDIGKFPKAPRDQNTLWYRLYKRVDQEVTVLLAHRHYLLFRDLATLSLLLLIIAPPALYFVGTTEKGIWFSFGLFLTQYVATAIAARNNGVRLVTNVLAVHSSKPSTGKV